MFLKSSITSIRYCSKLNLDSTQSLGAIILEKVKLRTFDFYFGHTALEKIVHILFYVDMIIIYFFFSFRKILQNKSFRRKKV